MTRISIQVPDSDQRVECPGVSLFRLYDWARNNNTTFYSSRAVRFMDENRNELSKATPSFKGRISIPDGASFVELKGRHCQEQLVSSKKILFSASLQRHTKHESYIHWSPAMEYYSYTQLTQ